MSPMVRGALLTVLMACLLGACGTPPEASPTTPAATPTLTPSGSPSEIPSATALPTSTDEPSPSATATLPPIAADPPALALEAVAGGLASPISIASVPDGRLLVNERRGRVISVDPASGATDLALDIGDRVLGQGEQGLLGLVLHPDWPDDDRVFVHYTDRRGGTVLSAFTTASVDPPRFDPASEAVLLQHPQPFTNHNGGQLAFGPDGYLYLGLGDGGSGGDPLGNGQNPDEPLGSILRFDVDADPGDASYAIPNDNPFVDGGGAPEVFLYGLRNPWRFSFDRLSGLLWIGDVGQRAYEEIDRIDPAADGGGNLGWNVMEGAHCFTDANCDPSAFIGPVSEYGHDAGCSVTGGYVYRGGAIADLGGWYLFGDYCSGLVFGVPSDITELTPPRLLLETGVAVSAFGEDADGELYLADIAGGVIYRIVAAD